MKTEKKSGAERTQLAVRDEWWSDERVKSFLALEPSRDEGSDFHALLKAYRGMIPEAFSRFVHFFNAAGRDINARNHHGQTLLEIVREHQNSGEYAQILEQAGADTH